MQNKILKFFLFSFSLVSLGVKAGVTGSLDSKKSVTTSKPQLSKKEKEDRLDAAQKKLDTAQKNLAAENTIKKPAPARIRSLTNAVTAAQKEVDALK